MLRKRWRTPPEAAVPAEEASNHPPMLCLKGLRGVVSKLGKGRA